MARDIAKVYESILRMLSTVERRDREALALTWSRRDFAYELTMWVNSHIVATSSDERSVRIYAKLCGCSPKEMRKTFIQDNR